MDSARPLGDPVDPPPPLDAPRLALPPPVSLIPRVRLLVVRPLPELRWLERLFREDPAFPVDSLLRLPVVRPAVSSPLLQSERIFSVHSPIWSLRLLS